MRSRSLVVCSAPAGLAVALTLVSAGARADEESAPVATAPEPDKAAPACDCACDCKAKEKSGASDDKPRCGCAEKKSGWVMGGLRASMTSLRGSDHDTTRVGQIGRAHV